MPCWRTQHQGIQTCYNGWKTVPRRGMPRLKPLYVSLSGGPSTIWDAFPAHGNAIWCYPMHFRCCQGHWPLGARAKWHRGRLHASKISSNNADRELRVFTAYSGERDVPPARMEKAAFGKVSVRGMAHTDPLSVCRVANVNTACRALSFGQSASRYVTGQ